MTAFGPSVELSTLMQGNYTLNGHTIERGRSNIRDFGQARSDSVSHNKTRREEAHKTKKEQRDASPEAPHATPLDKYIAILWKNEKTREYARNAAKYIRTNRVTEYSTFTHLGPQEFQDAVNTRASIGVLSNFDPASSGQTRPYRWQAHHMIPGEAFYLEDSDNKPVFDKEENFDILKQTPYEIDHGHNMIMLPCEGWAVPVHALLQHPNNHNGYSKDIMEALKCIDNEIDTLRGQSKEHKDIVANCFTSLKNLEEDLWFRLITRSRKAVFDAAAGRLYVGPWCRFQRKDGTLYDSWPTLW